ncbi:hypothetical protein KSF73_07705 [Burkholderiaceae bacterium DAT-1]|nr:hypothetical protein [Burkholderiaceae bacterium DAT-1]
MDTLDMLPAYAEQASNRDVTQALDTRTDVVLIGGELERMLASDLFTRSKRLSRLLRYLVEHVISGSSHTLKEYSIGLDVFDKHPSSYDPCVDPIVRVQVGRLREKLQQYYSQHAALHSIRFEIPLGNYVPMIHRMCPEMENTDTAKLIVLSIQGISMDHNDAQFALGLREELLTRLFHTVGGIVTPSAFGRSLNLADQDIAYALEGSVRFESTRARVSIRLTDIHTGGLVWVGQFDEHAVTTIDAQETLARSICKQIGTVLHKFDIRHPQVWAPDSF